VQAATNIIIANTRPIVNAILQFFIIHYLNFTIIISCAKTSHD
jgi:hypothetical protein